MMVTLMAEERVDPEWGKGLSWRVGRGARWRGGGCWEELFSAEKLCAEALRLGWAGESTEGWTGTQGGRQCVNEGAGAVGGLVPRGQWP